MFNIFECIFQLKKTLAFLVLVMAMKIIFKNDRKLPSEYFRQ